MLGNSSIEKPAPLGRNTVVGKKMLLILQSPIFVECVWTTFDRQTLVVARARWYRVFAALWTDVGCGYRYASRRNNHLTFFFPLKNKPISYLRPSFSLEYLLFIVAAQDACCNSVLYPFLAKAFLADGVPCLRNYRTQYRWSIVSAMQVFRDIPLIGHGFFFPVFFRFVLVKISFWVRYNIKL